MKKLNQSLNKLQGFATVMFLLLLTGTSMIIGNHVKMNNKERRNFYGKNISLSREKDLLAKNIIYFDYNSYKIKQPDPIYLYAHARYLLKNPKLNLLITGHADNKGSVEYNFKLGMLRATAVANLLTSKGVNSNRIIIISYANQIPANINNNYNQNDLAKFDRRVELNYINFTQAY